MTEAQAIDIRTEAVLWLQDELRLMNDNGAHWMKGAFYRDGQMCIKGASNLVLTKRIDLLGNLDLKNKITEMFDWLFDPEDGVTEEDYDTLLGESRDLRAVASETESTSQWIAVQDAVEIALGLAITKTKQAEREAHFREVGGYTDDEIKRSMERFNPSPSLTQSAEYHEGYITRYNDEEAEGWEDIVKVHELAIELVKNGDSPLTWEEYGKALTAA